MTIDPDDGQIPRNLEPVLARRVQHAHGDLVADREDRGRQVAIGPAAAEHPMQGRLATVHRKARSLHQGGIRFDAGPLQRKVVTAMPVHRRGEPVHVVQVVTEERDPTMAEVQQMLRRLPADLDVVDHHARHAFHRRADGHHRHPKIA